MSSAPAVETPTNSEKYETFNARVVFTLCSPFSDSDWKKNLKIPAKDTRKKTEVSRGCIINNKRVCI